MEGKALTSAIKETVRKLRREQTNAEWRLWNRLRARQIGGFKFRRQYPIGPFIADFCCYDARLIVEIDGSVHLGDIAVDRDKNRTEALEQQGFRVIRFWNDEVCSNIDQVCDEILRQLREKSNCPLPEGEGRRRPR